LTDFVAFTTAYDEFAVVRIGLVAAH